MSTSKHLAEPERAGTSTLMSRRQWLQTALTAAFAATLARPLSLAHAGDSKKDAEPGAKDLPAPGPAKFGATLELSALGGAAIELLYWRQDFQALLLATDPAGADPKKAVADNLPIRLTKLLDEATPGLQQMAHSAEVSKKGRLTITRNDGAWMRADLTDVSIVAISLTSQGAAGPTETLTLAFDKAKWRLEHGGEDSEDAGDGKDGSDDKKKGKNG